EKAASPRKDAALRKALKNASWVASRASARFPVIRTASAKIRSSYRRMSSSKALWLPSRNAAKSSASGLASVPKELDLLDGYGPSSAAGEIGYPDEPVAIGRRGDVYPC